MKNQTTKKILSIVCLVSLLSCSFATVFGGVSFSDLKDTPYEAGVSALVEKGIINGYEDGSFRPENGITRAETCIVIAKAMNPGEEKYQQAGKNSFSDLHAGYDWAAKYVNYAAAMGAVDGYPDGSFHPAANVTYNELSAMILKGMGYRAENLTGVWPDNFQKKALELGIYKEVLERLTETQKKEFDYEAAATRGNAVFMVKAALTELEAQGKKDLPPAEENGYDWIPGDGEALTLHEAVEIMQTKGYLAEMAKLNKETDEAIAKGYSDNVKDLKSAISNLKDLQSKRVTLIEEQEKVNASIHEMEGKPSPSEADKAFLAQQKQLAQTLAASLAQIEGVLEQMGSKSTLEANKKMAELQRDFAEDNIDKNYEAELNSIEYQTVSLYYGVLQAQENVKVSQDNLALQEKLLKNVQLKYSVGTVTKLEVSAQELAVKNAKQDFEEAKSGLETARMNFNLLLGYEVKENVKLTDGLTPRGFPEVALQSAVDSAVKHRLSVVQMDYACEIQKLSLDLLRRTEGKTSGAYQKQESALALTELAYENMPKTLEIEIRSAYIALQNKYDAIQESQDTLAISKESLRLAELLFRSGMNTAADVQKAQVQVYQTNQLLMASISAYNLAVYEFEYMMDVGKERIDL